MTDGISRFVYATYIRTTPGELWAALTKADFIKKYWFAHASGDRLLGRSARRGGWSFPTGASPTRAEVAECAPPRRLALRWRHKWKPELAAEGEAFCVIALEPVEGAVELDDQPFDRADQLQADRSRRRRLAAHPLQPQVSARDREDDSCS